MRLLEKVLAIGILFSLILKFNLISGGDEFLMGLTLSLTIIYYPLGFLFFNQIRLRDIFKRAAYKDTNAYKIIIAIIAGLGFSTICIGSLFKLFHFSGANEMLTVGLTTILIVSLVALVFYFRKDKVFGKYILIRTLIIGGTGVVLFL